MQVSVTARHGSINDDVRDHITGKSEKLLTFLDRVFAIEVTVDFQNKNLLKVELLVDAEHRHNFVAQDEGEEVIPTFDRAYNKMEQQIRKYKEKIQDHRRDKPLNEIAESAVPDETDDDES